jgi:hypothetical protein
VSVDKNCAGFIMINATITAIKLTAFRKRAGATPTAAMTTPANAGPIMRAALI